MTDDRPEYREATIGDINNTLVSTGGQPILFFGSGISRRYFGAPDWRGLLQQMAGLCPNIDRDFAYYEQSFESLRHVGAHFAASFKEWAWSSGRSEFPDEYFSSAFPQDVFLKHKVSEYLESLTPSRSDIDSPSDFAEELRLLQHIRPHALITTNYDRFLDRLFLEYEPVIGQRILTAENTFVGEIFKIHGCVSEPAKLVLTEADYQDFAAKKKYLSAKLLTFFVEHPVLIAGYSAEDPNIKAILADIDINLGADGALVENIFLLRRPRPSGLDSHPPREDLISLGEGQRLRIRTIVTDQYDWVFEAFGVQGAMERIRPRLLRGLLARTFDLVRHDIPKRALEVDYSILEKAVDDDEELAKLFGITVVTDALHINVGYPYLLTGVAAQLGFPSWHGAQALLIRVRDASGVDLKSSDNKYHVAVKAGEKVIIHKYSPQMVELLRRVQEDPESVPDLDID